jgi:hypothetical protein
LERLAPVDRLAHDLQVRLSVEDHPQAAADQCLIICDQDPRRHACT